jgi:hypothetical protein
MPELDVVKLRYLISRDCQNLCKGYCIFEFENKILTVSLYKWIQHELIPFYQKEHISELDGLKSLYDKMVQSSVDNIYFD